MHFSDQRHAGLLLHITSLPSAFGIGDLGPAAYSFADMLFKARQRYWQILPLSPIEQSQSWSPYSSPSTMAGNTLLISPELLERDGLLPKGATKAHAREISATVDYDQVVTSKRELLREAFGHFEKSGTGLTLYQAFCQREAYWLDDFSHYMAIRNHHEGKPWFQWPKAFKDREEKTLSAFLRSHAKEIELTRWSQFVFDQQWRQLRLYCHSLNISFIGDLPFYVGYDSVDVWANRSLFALEDDGAIRGVAGVPPDYFNENGQRWGMPVYQWDAMHKEHYRWWTHRIQKNLQQVDVLRLDHFRAFDEYWEVPAAEKTAIRGTWKKGPGHELFDRLSNSFPHMPFIAEDLGDISPSVYALRDRYNLPGMKVLQFAFDEQMAKSDHIPHNYANNYAVYTGTHDNNTTVGWFAQELDAAARKRVERYLGTKLSQNNIHDELIRLAYLSVANLAIVPVQDVLGLGSTARMNMPASTEGNWSWRMTPGQLEERDILKLAELTEITGRA